MITISHHSERYIALAGAYQHRDAIKAIADFPDVRWDTDTKVWLIDNRLWDELAQMLGPWLAPASVDFWCDFHTYEPPPVQRRRTQREIVIEKKREQAAAGRFGRVIVEYMNQGDTK